MRLSKADLSKAAPWVGYPLFFSMCLVAWIPRVFPYAKLEEYLVTSFAAATQDAKTSYTLQMDPLGAAGLTGVRLRNVHMLATDPGSEETYETRIDRTDLHLSWLSLLTGTPAVTWRLWAFGGEVKGNLSAPKGTLAVHMDLHNVHLGEISLLRTSLGIPVEGVLEGSVHLTSGLTPAQAGGIITLRVHDLVFGDNQAKLPGGIPFPRLQVGTLLVDTEGKQGLWSLRQGEAEGNDLTLHAQGTLQQKEPGNRSVLESTVQIQIHDTFRTQNKLAGSFFGVPGSTTPPLVELLDPRVRAAKQEGGGFAFRLHGLWESLQWGPADSSGGNHPSAATSVDEEDE